jgi:hypothetical protein
MHALNQVSLITFHSMMSQKLSNIMLILFNASKWSSPTCFLFFFAFFLVNFFVSFFLWNF